MQEVFERDGILVGWKAFSRGCSSEVFIPRRDEDIDADRAAIAALLRRAAK